MLQSWHKTLFLRLNYNVSTNFVRSLSKASLNENKGKNKFGKDVFGALPSAYDPKLVEPAWLKWWQKQQYFIPEDPLLHDPENSYDSKVFSMVLPPPNITGPLHLGHALTIAIQDSIVRWQRMLGKKVLWVPGYDHAGIATQVVVEKKLWNECKQSRHDIGREKFIEELLQWKEEKVKMIYDQLHQLGSTLDFNRATFTMDTHMSKAVTEAFVQLFDEGLLYRKQRFVNWSCILQSAIADLEVEHVKLDKGTHLTVPGMKEQVEFGIMERFAYPVMNDDPIIVSTTRLETMLGDTAVAVHSKDSRYQHFIGKLAVHPFTGENIPIIADDSVDISFGTGALKITPAHSEVDYEIAQKYNLPFHEVFSDNGYIKEVYGDFKGLPRFEARRKIRDALTKLGLYYGKTNHPTTLPLCSRSGDVIEPRLKYQWYFDCSEMANKATIAARDGDIKFFPDRYRTVWLEWLKHIHDWCVSRQIWWGHRIPAYHIKAGNKEEWIAARDKEEAISKGAKALGIDEKEIEVQQDEDVLDTWFSSALIPLSVHGWPDNLLEDFYPLSLMETGHDIIFYWVARMVMMGQHFTGKLPFQNVLLHGVLCDGLGRKMSKSLGNVVDPMDIIHGASLKKLKETAKEAHRQGYLTDKELNLSLQSHEQNFPNGIPECGADGLRFALLSYNFKSERINIDIMQIRSCRNFCNKIWQGTRFFLTFLEKCNKEFVPVPLNNQYKFSDIDSWILSRLATTVEICNEAFQTHDLHYGTNALQKFWIQDFCDVYIESAKPLTHSGQKEDAEKVSNIMFKCIETFLHLICPFMPFLSEELYQRLATKLKWNWKESICISSYPSPEDWYQLVNKELESTLRSILELIYTIRSMKSFYGMSSNRPNVIISIKNEPLFKSMRNFQPLLITLSTLQSLNFHFGRDEDCEQFKDRNWVSRVHNDSLTLFMELQGVTEEELILSRRKKREKIQRELEKLNKLMSDKNYGRKSSRSIRELHIEKKANLEAELQRMVENEKLS